MKKSSQLLVKLKLNDATLLVKNKYTKMKVFSAEIISNTKTVKLNLLDHSQFYTELLK
jgi:hypothetical protein